MKKILSVLLILVLTFALALTSCGKKEVQSIEITEGFKFEYELGETPDYSGVRAKIIYNDGTTAEVDGSELVFGSLDTSTPGKKDVAVTYDGFTQTFTVTVKSASVDVGAKELQSIEYFEGLNKTYFENEIINFDAIKIIANYVDSKGTETEETISAATNKNIKHNGADIDTSKPGTYTLTITFMGKTVNVPINVVALEILELQVDADSVDTTIYENQDFVTDGMIVKAVYNNGEKHDIAVKDLTVTRDGNIVTISYGGKSVQLTLSYDTPFITAINVVKTGYENTDNKIIFGDKFSTNGVVVTATYSNNTTKDLKSDEFTCTHNVGQVGTGIITVTYNADDALTATASITVLGISKISIDASSVTTTVKVDGSYSATNLKVLITCEDGTKASRSLDQGVTVGGETVDTAVKGTYYITATYGGIISSKLPIIVYEEMNYVIAGVTNPKEDFEDNKESFINKDYGYVVGDDNPFIFKLNVMSVNPEDPTTPIQNLSYTSYSEVYYNNVLLVGDELAKYCEIEETENSFDFTEEAIGKTFTIKTRPRFGVDGREADLTRELTFTVVDGYNIYEAIELNYLSNYDDFSIPNEERTFTQVVDSFLSTKGKTRPESLAGVVLHNDLTIEREDIPAEFFVASDRNNDFYDFLSVYSHATDKNNKTFTFHGNHYTIFSYNLPNVCEKCNKTGCNQDDTVSSGQLFRFSCKEINATDFNIDDYTTNLQNFYLRDDNPNNNVQAIAGRSMRGLIGMKVQFQKINVENIRLEAFYISFFLDNDYTVVDVNESIFFNSYQNQIYSYNRNPISGDDNAPAANHKPITLNITKSKITKSGGPVILNQIEHPELTKNSKSAPYITIDDSTEIWTYVTGTEAWFVANGATDIAMQLQALGKLVADNNMPKTFVRTTGENGATTGTDLNFMNMIMVNLVAGTNITDILNFTGDLDGKLAIGEKTYLDMDDTVALDGVHGYGSETVATQFATQASQKKKPIIISTHTDGAIIVDDGTVDGQQVAAPSASAAGNVEGLADGDYAAIYYGCFGFVFGYAPFQ